MTYIPVTEVQSNPFAPGTSELFKQLRDNPIAIAGGLAGAPRNVPLSLDLMLGGSSFALTGATPVEFVGLTSQSSLLIVWDITADVSQPVPFQIGYSTNNGSSWSPYQTITTVPTNETEQGMSHVSLTEGRLNMLPPITGAAGSNAIRLRRATGVAGGRVAILGLGRT